MLMKERFLVPAALLFCMCADVTFAADLLIPGTYHGDEVNAVTGEEWLGLVMHEVGGSELAPVALMVERVFDPVLDVEGDRTGKKVGVAGDASVLFVVRGVPELRPQPAVTAVTNVYLQPGEPVTIDVGADMPAQLTLFCSEPGAKEQFEQLACQLVLQTGETRAILFEGIAGFEGGEYTGIGSDALLKVIWAGDLNGDQAPDLLIDLADHYNAQEPTLFLSPSESPGGPPRKVAAHYSVGC